MEETTSTTLVSQPGLRWRRVTGHAPPTQSRPPSTTPLHHGRTTSPVRRGPAPRCQSDRTAWHRAASPASRLTEGGSPPRAAMPPSGVQPGVQGAASVLGRGGGSRGPLRQAGRTPATASAVHPEPVGRRRKELRETAACVCLGSRGSGPEVCSGTWQCVLPLPLKAAWRCPAEQRRARSAGPAEAARGGAGSGAAPRRTTDRAVRAAGRLRGLFSE